VGAVAGADIEGELNLAALVEALADFMLEVTAGGGSSGGNESWYGRGNNTESVESEGAADAAGGGKIQRYKRRATAASCLSCILGLIRVP
jgi:hypothetical protein